MVFGCILRKFCDDLMFTGQDEFRRVAALSRCAGIDVVALHSYASPKALDVLLTGYTRALAPPGRVGTAGGAKEQGGWDSSDGGGTTTTPTRLIVQEWGAMGANATAQAAAFLEITAVLTQHRVPSLYWSMDPSSNKPPLTTSFSISPPNAAPTQPGSTQQVWQTALYPAAQAAALAPAAVPWPEVWGCGPASAGALTATCEMNGACGTDGACACTRAWRGPTCAALYLRPTPRTAGLRHTNSSTWGGSIVRGTGSDGGDTWHMFSSFILGECGLNAWSINSEIVRAVADTPLGSYPLLAPCVTCSCICVSIRSHYIVTISSRCGIHCAIHKS